MKRRKTANRKNIGDRVKFEYREVLDARTQGLIRIGCAVVAGCPT